MLTATEPTTTHGRNRRRGRPGERQPGRMRDEHGFGASTVGSAVEARGEALGKAGDRSHRFGAAHRR